MTLDLFKKNLKTALLLVVTISSFNLSANTLDSLSLSERIDSIDWKNDHALNELDELLSNVHDSLSFEESIYFHENALDKAREFGNHFLTIEFAQTLANLFQIKPNLDKSIHFDSIALSHAKQENNKEFITKCLNNLGLNYLYNEDYFTAIDYFTQAKVSAQSAEDVSLELIIDNNIASCYFNSGLFEEAIIVINNSINLSEKENLKIVNNSFGLSSNYRLLLSCYRELNESDSVSFYIKQLEQHLPILEKDTMYQEDRVLYENELGEGLFDLANYYIQNNQLAIAKKYIDKLQTLSFAYPSSVYFASLDFAIQSEDYDKAETLLTNPPLDDIEDEEELYHGYAFKYYSKIGKHEKAIEYLKKQNEEEVNNLKLNLSNITKYTETKLDNTKKEQRIIAFEQEQVIQNNKNWFYLILLIFTVLLISILLYLYGVIKKRNASLVDELKDKAIIEEQKSKLQKNDAQKVKLFVNIAHELKTPISIIKGLIGKVGKSSVNGRTDQEIYSILNKNSVQLSEQIDQILAISKMEQFTPEVNKNIFYLNELVQKVMDDLKPKAVNKHIQLVLDTTEEPFLVETDIDKLTVIIKNLLNNAIKYSNKNDLIKINFNKAENGFYEIQIKDAGRGISEEDIPNIFDRFYQSNNTEPEGGFGIGLALSKEYIELLGGQIAVKSTLGIGSVFSLMLPKPPLEEWPEGIEIVSISSNLADNQDTEIVALPLEGEKKDILVVEDNPDFFVYLGSFLSPHFNLKHVRNGEEAKAFLSNNSTDLVLTDWMMQGMNGLELVRYLKQEERYRSIPIIMLTARSIITDEFKAIKEGVDAYFTKPVEEHLLISKIIYLVQSSKNHAPNAFLETYLTTEQEEGIIINAEDQVWILKVEEIIKNQIHDFNLNLNYIAQFMDMSLYSFSKRFKEITGTSPNKFIQEFRLWEARRILEEKEINSVKIVSFTVGFKDTKNFSRNFKHKFGKYPSDYL